MRFLVRLVLLVCICTISSWSPSYSENEPTNSNCELHITVLNNAVHFGSRPKFVIKLSNKSSEVLKVLDLEKRKDLADAALDIRITSEKGEIRFKSAISDPGPITENDYVLVLPKSEISFTVSSYKRYYLFELEGLHEVTGRLMNFPGETLTSKPESFWVIK